MRVVQLAVAAALVAGLLGCGGDDDSVSQEELQQATKEARQEAESEAELKDLREKVESLQQGETTGGNPPAGGATTTTVVPSGSGVPSDAESCGAGVFARSGSTSCSFALNVASDYYSSGSNRFQSFSPATGQTYTMTCSGGSPVVCTGGNNAAVYLLP